MIDDAAVVTWEALFRAQVAVMRRLTAEFPEAEITLGEYDVLFTLSRQPGHRLRLRDLTEQVLLTQSSVSRLTDRLAGRHLVDKQSSSEDARGVTVTLTDHGWRVFRQVARYHMESISRRLSGALTGQEMATLAGLCDKLRTFDAGAPCRAVLSPAEVHSAEMHRAEDGRTTDAAVAGPATSDPEATGPKPAGPEAAGPEAAGPQAAGPQAAGSGATSTGAAGRRAGDPGA